MSRRPVPPQNPPNRAVYAPPSAHPAASPTLVYQPPPLPHPGHRNYTPHPGYSGAYAAPARSPADAFEYLSQQIAQLVDVTLTNQAQNDGRLNRMENTIQRLIVESSSARAESRRHIVDIATLLQHSHDLGDARLHRIENMMGMGSNDPEPKEEKTLLHRFDLLSYAVEELLERVRDPEANLLEGPLHHDMATSPLKGMYADAAVVPKTPSPKRRLSSVAVGSSPSSPDQDIFSENRTNSTMVATDESRPSKEWPDGARDEVQSDIFGDMVARNIPKSTFASASPVTRALVPANWDRSPSPEEALVFSPDNSLEGMQAYSALPNQSTEDGTIASLRRASTMRHSVPLTSTSFAPVPEATLGSPAQSRLSTPNDHDSRSLSPDDVEPPSPMPDDPSPTFYEPPADHIPRLDALDEDFPSLSAIARSSRSTTMEPDDEAGQRSPSAETLQEELSVLNMMSPRETDPHSDLPSSPIPPQSEVSHSPVPSSVTPSPMRPRTQTIQTPPRLTLVIPDPVSPTSGGPRPEELFDTFMSPLSPSEASRDSSPASDQSDSEDEEEQAPEPQSSMDRPTTSVLRLAPSTPHTKKRKSDGDGEEAEQTPDSSGSSSSSSVAPERPPPSKRSRPDPSTSTASTSRTSKAAAGKGKKRRTKKVKAEGETVLWPAMTSQADAAPDFSGKFIGCEAEGCNRWYHCTCMGVGPGDPRLEDTFICPFCVASSSSPYAGRRRRWVGRAV
ncbi:hypothetical protein R3P38DRAFT_2879967 [Favolaschia claudopus]|uniref:Zinc finger PHD-type domain-containing protein n=1 Tax=Favolaschia claudopus TaxID=2862362 RepID=A0AAW0CWX4_9AGAR